MRNQKDTDFIRFNMIHFLSDFICRKGWICQGGSYTGGANYHLKVVQKEKSKRISCTKEAAQGHFHYKITVLKKSVLNSSASYIGERIRVDLLCSVQVYAT